jgi:protein-S-isoprenylcysteine O-methyltransferase Ste14
VYLVLFALSGLAASALAPEAVLAERSRGPLRSGQARADLVFVPIFGVLILGWFALLGFDAVRFEWTSVPLWLRLVGAAAFVVANAVIVWVLRANPFASGSVRVAPEQQVASTGPYAVVRHPMYSSVVPYLAGTALLLGSAIGALTSLLLIVALAVRIGIEERTLRKGLPGYRDYTARVRWRLVPGVW